MTLSAIISITISLTFIYLVLSLAISEIQEILASVLNLRSQNLKKHIYALFGEEPLEEGLNFGDFIKSFSQKKTANPSDTLVEKLYEHYLKQPLLPASPKNKKSQDPETIPTKYFADCLIELVRDKLNEENPNDFNQEDNLKKILDAIETSKTLPKKMQKDLSAIVRKAMNRFEKVEDQWKNLDQEIQSWFNNSMEYASQVYRKKSRLISRLLAMVLVLALNIDTINIIDNLSKSEILSSTLGNTATDLVNSNAQKTTCADIQDDAQLQTCLTSVKNEITIVLDNLDNFPIGWNWSDPLREQFTPLNFANILNAIVGWGISIFAISMGAPFWYQVLNQLINIRSNSQRNSSKN